MLLERAGRRNENVGMWSKRHGFSIWSERHFCFFHLVQEMSLNDTRERAPMDIFNLFVQEPSKIV